MEPKFFATPAAWRAWLERHHDTHAELLVGLHKKSSGAPSITWPESVDEALCFGWIDGVRNRIDERSYQIRFTPRKPSSIWSAINIERVSVLRAEGRMHESGMKAYARRSEERSKIYSYEQAETPTLGAGEEAEFRRNKAAWTFFEAQPPGYRRLMIWRIVSAKRAETRRARLAQLIEASREGRRL